MPLRTIARITAFRPGQSPPPVSTPMRIVNGKYSGHATALLLAALAVLAGCGSGEKKDDRARGATLTIYTSLPRHGVSARAGDAVAAGERLALADAGSRAGGRRLRLVELDDSDPEKGVTWDPAAVEENAKRAAGDSTTIAYVGELDFGGSAISVPVTNGKGILQVSPGDGLTSLTQVQPGSFKTSPDRYYPNGRRTFVRLVPNDLEQAEGLVQTIGARGTKSLAVVHDDRLFGREMAAQVAAAAAGKKLAVTDVQEAAHDEKGYVSLARKLAQKHPDAVAYLGVGGPKAELLLAELRGVMPRTPFYGSSGMAGGTSGFPDVPSVELLDPVFPPSAYGRPARRLLARLAHEAGRPLPANALFGYEAMRVVIDALDRAGGRSDDRDAVSEAAFARGERRSVLG